MSIAESTRRTTAMAGMMVDEVTAMRVKVHADSQTPGKVDSDP